MSVPALLWEHGERMAVRCGVCRHFCLIPNESAGFCKVRVNRGGDLYSLVSDHVVSANLDPIEKKPLFHFLPGTGAFSIGTPGCNMACSFCQNHSLSQGVLPPLHPMRPKMPEALGANIAQAALDAGAASIAYTYNEPTVAIELIQAAAPKALEANLANILVSNGYQSPQCLNLLRELIQAANFDLKSFRDDFYRKYCEAHLKGVLRTLETALSLGWWVEVTTLLIPGLNDSDVELRGLARFIKERLGASVPWHVSRFRPAFRMTDAPVTAVEDLERARAIGMAEGLLFVYTGNVPGHESESTFCPNCKSVFVRRRGHQVDVPAFSHTPGQCAHCQKPIPGVWSRPRLSVQQKGTA